MEVDEPSVLAVRDAEAACDEPTVIDADELAKALLDEQWREFCLSAERYAAETTRREGWRRA